MNNQKQLLKKYYGSIENMNKVVTLENELIELENWFNYYDNQINQYNRNQRLNLIFDKDIVELDNEAKEKQLRIREIRDILNNEKSGE